MEFGPLSCQPTRLMERTFRALGALQFILVIALFPNSLQRPDMRESKEIVEWHKGTVAKRQRFHQLVEDTLHGATKVGK